MKRIATLLAFVTVTTLTGCGSEGPQPQNPLPTYPITGRVTVDGSVPEEPFYLAVTATPEGGLENSALKATPGGFTSKTDGTFTLSTYRQGDGVPPGTYKLTFRLGSLNMMTARFAGDEFEGKYNDPETSEFSVTVTGEESEPIDVGLIELEK